MVPFSFILYTTADGMPAVRARETRHRLTEMALAHGPAQVARGNVLVRFVKFDLGLENRADPVALPARRGQVSQIIARPAGAFDVEDEHIMTILGHVDPARPHGEDFVVDRLEQLDHARRQPVGRVGDDQQPARFAAQVERLAVVVAVAAVVREPPCEPLDLPSIPEHRRASSARCRPRDRRRCG